jgi:hypothetical protein
MEDVNSRQIWEGLLRKMVKEGRPLSPPPPFYVRLDEGPVIIKEIHIPNVPA